MAALRQRRIRPDLASRRDAGYTLVEVMVAMLLTTIMVTSVFSVALTVKTGGNKGESKIKAAAGARMVAALLKNYVTGDPASAVIPGPGTGANSWSMTGNGIVDACGCPSCTANCYALAHGTHSLTGVMGDFEQPPPLGKNARVSYFVDANTLVGGRPVPAVTITTTWTD